MPRLIFTLRDVFWLPLVVGMGVGWWLQIRVTRQLEIEFVQILKEMGQEMAAQEAELAKLRSVPALKSD